MSGERPVSRRGFLRAATGAAALTGASSTAAAQESGGGGSGTVEVDLKDYEFDPGTSSPLTIPPGTTVKFVWKTGGHNIHVDTQPDGANWQGVSSVESAGYTTSHTFTVEGKYHFWCVPHKSLGMVGDIVVQKGASLPGQGGGGGGATPPDPEKMGVPFQAHYVGIAALLGLTTTLIFTFFFLKYGETPHSGYPEER